MQLPKFIEDNKPWIAHVAPFVAYVLLTMVAANFEDYYPIAYTIAVVVVAAICLLLIPSQKPFKVHYRIIDSIVVGAVGIALWIPLSALRLEATFAEYLPAILAPAERASFNPFAEIPTRPLAIAFIVVRLVGIAVLTPLVEELFWRGFLTRWIIDPHWSEVPVGRFTPFAFLVVTVMFTLAHPEWLAASVYCALLNVYLMVTKDLWKCVVAHAVSNLLLAAYVLWSGEWWLW